MLIEHISHFCLFFRLTPTMQAYRYNHVEIGRWLLEHGGSLNEADKYGYTALHYSAWSGSFDAVVSLVNNGVSIDVKNNYG